MKEFLKSIGMSAEAITIIKMCSALPLLPKDMLQLGLSIVEDDIRRCSPELTAQLSTLLNFFKGRYLIDPNFSVCGSPERTDYGR